MPPPSSPEAAHDVLERRVDAVAHRCQHADDDDRHQYEDEGVLHQALALLPDQQLLQPQVRAQHGQFPPVVLAQPPSLTTMSWKAAEMRVPIVIRTPITTIATRTRIRA